MRRKYGILVSGLGFILVVAFNACTQDGTTLTATGSNNTSIAGNPLAPITEKVIDSVCDLITRCNNQVYFDRCEAGILATTGVASKLGLSQLTSQLFSGFMQMEGSGQIAGNINALNTCNQGITTMNCSDPVVQSAYDPSQADSFAGILNLFSSQAGSCSDVATEIQAPQWSWSAPWGSAGINFSLPQNTPDPMVTVFNGKLYASWIENNNGYNVRVKVSDGINSWQAVDGGAGGGLNYSASKSAQAPYLIAFNAKLYAVWVENNGNSDLVRLKVYNGNDANPSWTSIDGGGINQQALSNASMPELAVFNSKLYATWVEKKSNINQIRVAVYSGDDALPTWAFVDGNLSGGINFNKNLNAKSPRLLPLNSNLYATWSEVASTGVQQIRVAVYNGQDSTPSWSFVDGNSTHGLNFATVQNAQNPSLAVSQSKLYITWQEWNSPTSEQIRVAVFNGNISAPSWTFVDGGKANGLNWDIKGDAQLPQLLGTGTGLYITWREQVLGQGILRVRSYNGNDDLPVWPSGDGNSSMGLNMLPGNDVGFSFKRNSMLVEMNSSFYLIWSESNRIQIKSGLKN